MNRQNRSQPIDAEPRGTTNEAARQALRLAANHLLAQSKGWPAPCGCAPRNRCDRHCRVKIRSVLDTRGRSRWAIECDGSGDVEDNYQHGPYFGVAAVGASLESVHQEASDHVIKHRARSFMSRNEERFRHLHEFARQWGKEGGQDG